MLKRVIQRINQSDIGHRMAYGAGWSLIGTAAGKFIVLVAGILCAHILTKEQYGEFGMIRSTVNMFVVFGTAGLGVTASKFIAEYRSQQKERIPSIYMLTNGFAFVTGLVIVLVVYYLAPFLAAEYLHAPHLVNPLRMGVLLLFVTVINGAQTGTLSGFEDFKSIAINNFFGSLSESVFMLIGAYYWGIFGAVAGFGTGYIVLYVLHNLAIRRNFSERGITVSRSAFRREDLRLLYKFSLPAMLSSVLVTPTYWLIRSFLARSGGFEEVAAFEAADQWRTIILFLPTAISGIALPILSSLVGGDGTRYWRTFWLNLGLVGGISFVLALLISVFSPFIMRFYGADYAGDHLTLVVLVASTVFSSMATVVGASIQSRAKVWVGFGFNFLWALMIIGLSSLFLRRGLGATGIAWAILIAYFVHTLLQLLYMLKTYQCQNSR